MTQSLLKQFSLNHFSVYGMLYRIRILLALFRKIATNKPSSPKKIRGKGSDQLVRKKN